MVDFSHLRIITAWTVARSVDRGRTVTDEWFLEAAERVTPALLPPENMKDLRIELDPAAQRRGRPRKAGTRAALLVAELEKLDRPDVPASFIPALIVRLKSSILIREFDLAMRFHRHQSIRQRDVMIRGLYPQLYDLLGTARRGSVTHPLLGEIAIPDCNTRSERAREMTRAVMLWLFDASPSANTIRNIVAKKFRRFSVHPRGYKML